MVREFIDMQTDVVNFFERANNSFLKEQSKFILSGVSERSLCRELMKCLLVEKETEWFNNYMVLIEYYSKGKMDKEYKVFF
ncbi:hypothetical protein M2139_001034 [Enterococcus sp. PF1-24]|uniref:hypothetical protein n=1 Tax=unclassified Enterococcus TaxID=2608891 RepID=UPI0024752BEC|nr:MULTISPECIES: hypothetical protein [unclassified Enterococcus]MDH6364049.1 hypothetical protein [Enterococcus sp. PFB1-1]MDH6401150.1 hypothetical protein [Enterococcus sp. PF1-24]